MVCLFASGYAQNIPAAGRSNVLEIGNWNLEWFGKTAPGYGPANDTLQQALVLKALRSSDIDVWALCEVSDKKAYDTLLSKLPGYEGVLASYFPEQKTAVLFKTERFRNGGYKLLGTQNPDSFSSYRFPLELALVPQQDIGIDTLFIIVLHLKANTGNDSAKMQAYNSRKRSADWIRMYLSRQKTGKFVAVLGDWNDDLDKSIYNQLPSPFSKLQGSPYGFSFISRLLTDKGISTTVSYPDPIDHQLLSDPLKSKWMQDSVFVWRLDRYINSYGSLCSDHYPVYSLYTTYSSNLESKQVYPYAVYPNPVHGSFRIKGLSSNSEVPVCSLQDAQGRSIILHADENGVFSIPEEISAGIYCIHYLLEGVFYSNKICIEK
jgi:exonuclease III